MSDNKLKVLLCLQDELLTNLQSSKAYECLKIMCDESIRALQSGNTELIEFTRWKLKARYDREAAANNADPKDLQKWIDDKQLATVLKNIIGTEHQSFKEIGYIPIVRKNQTKGGKGHERSYWLDIEKYEKNTVETVQIDSNTDDDEVVYHRASPDTIKVSLLYKWLFPKGEMRNRSLRGLALITIVFGWLIFWVLYLIVVALITVKVGENFTSWNIFFLFVVGLFSLTMWQAWFKPIFDLPEHRVIKAPLTFISISELDVEIEMYRDQYKNQITRFTRFVGTCPICTADVVLRKGKPDFSVPLVGRCVESPFAHVYSFDRVTMKGRKISV